LGNTPDEDVAVISTLAVHAAATLVASAWALGAAPGACPTPGWVAPDVMPPPAAPTTVDWRTLATLDWRTGGTSDRLRSLDGTLVRIPGFAVPLQDFASQVTEFLLVPWAGACVHTPPPPPNQMVLVVMDRGRQARLNGWAPVWAEGVLRIEAIRSYYGFVGFRLEGQRVYPYTR